jgi:hypothetical protein
MGRHRIGRARAEDVFCSADGRMKRVLLLSITVGMLFLEGRAHAAWPITPTEDAPVCLAAADQHAPQLTSDGAGGFIVVWEDLRTQGNSRDLYAQRIDAAGNPLWTVDGVPVAALGALQASPAIVSDGAGGAIIAWSDARNDTSDVYAQRIDENGAPVWAANGVALAAQTGIQTAPALVADGNGGAFLAYLERPVASYDRAHAQHVSSTGALLWAAGGVPLTTGLTEEQRGVQVIGDGAGGIIVGFRTVPGDYSVRAQRLTGTGTRQWGTAGVTVSDTSNGSGVSFALGTDGSNGAVIAWTGNNDIYAQRVTSAGALGWASSLALCAATGVQDGLSGAPDGQGGLIVTWQDRRDAANTSVYARRVSPSGSALWAQDGVPISTQETYVATPRVFVDGAHAFVLWRDVRNAGWAIYAQRVGLDGARAFVQDGVPLSTNPKGGHFDWTGIGDGSGGLLVAFRLGTAGVNTDIHTKRLARDGSLGTPLDGGTDAGADSSTDAGGGDAPSDAATGGMAGSDGGGAAGAGASAGTGSGGAAGTASGGSSGTSDGSAPSGGTGATGTGGTGTGGAGTGGSTAGASSGAPAAAPRKQPDEGCGCRVPGSDPSKSASAVLGLLLAAAALSSARWRTGPRPRGAQRFE